MQNHTLRPYSQSFAPILGTVLRQLHRKAEARNIRPDRLLLCQAQCSPAGEVPISSGGNNWPGFCTQARRFDGLSCSMWRYKA